MKQPAISAILALKLFRYDTKIQQKSELHSIIIEGEYSEGGGVWKPLTSQIKFDNLTFRNITVKGHFSRELPVGEYLYLNLDQVWVSLKVNEQEIYSLLPEGREARLTQAMGRQYSVVESPGITPEDTIELNFGNYYINSHLIQFDELLWEMYAVMNNFDEMVQTKEELEYYGNRIEISSG